MTLAVNRDMDHFDWFRCAVIKHHKLDLFKV
jgi:hypothetical protein